jgi:ADP-ribose pyrophosphatase
MQEDERRRKSIIEIREARSVYRNKWGTLFDDCVEFPDGSEGTYLRFVWASPYSVAVLPITAQGDLIFVDIFRHASRKWHCEVPKGFGAADAKPVDAAGRELAEETGYSSSKWQSYGTVWTDPGFNAAECHLFIARGCEISRSPAPEHSEVISGVRIFSPARAAAGLAAGFFDDALTTCLVQRFLIESAAG